MPHNDYIQDYLMHHGILGQKWGVRRYQNADGSLTPAGQRRYGYDSYKKTQREHEKRVSKYERQQVWERNVKQGKGKPDISRAEDAAKSLVKATQDVVSTGNKLIDKVPRKKSSYEDLSNISEKDLQNIVNRIRLEQQYYALTNQNTSRGRDIAHTILDTVGSVVLTAGGIIGAIAAIKNLKHDNFDKDYLMHHGILGQKWGVRRYQPYSTTGPRKGGKTGKEIGQAKNKKIHSSYQTRYLENKASVARKSSSEWYQIARNKKQEGNAKGYEKAKIYGYNDYQDAKKYENKAKLSQVLDDKMNRYLKTRTNGEKIVSLITSGRYDIYRSMGYNKKAARGKALLLSSAIAFSERNKFTAGKGQMYEAYAKRNLK